MLHTLFPCMTQRPGKQSKIILLNEKQVQKYVDLIEQFKVTDGKQVMYRFP